MKGIWILVCIYWCAVALRTPKRVAVIGGGAAGYFSAIECAKTMKDSQIPAEVVVFEAGRIPLNKVAISGGGRCNVMHNPSKKVADISKGYPRGKKELLGPLNTIFSPTDTFNWFNDRGARLKIEDDGRVFPSSDKSETIVNLLERAVKQNSIEIYNQCRVEAIVTSGGKFQVSYFDNAQYSGNQKQTWECDSVIMATGSARTGHEIMEKFGHSKIETVPSLFSFKINDTDLTELTGLSTQYGKIKLALKKEDNTDSMKKLMREIADSIEQSGPILITQQGISGPGVLKLSAYGAKILSVLKYNFDIEINWVNGLSVNQIISHLENEKKAYPNRMVGKCFPYLPFELQKLVDGREGGQGSYNIDEDDGQHSVINRRLWQYLLRRCQIDIDSAVWQSITKQTIAKIANEIVNSKFQVVGRGLYKDEFVTCGGVSLQEINMSTMESKIAPGVFCAGEILNIDGITGGYNFQSAWTTGYSAGNSCGNSFNTKFTEE